MNGAEFPCGKNVADGIAHEDRLYLKRAKIDFGLNLSRIITNEEIKPQFVTKNQNGFYWGVKMYTAMGYKPNSWDLYPHLSDFYKFCEDNQIPITCHCSPGGMMVGDEHNYMRAELKKKPPYKPKGYRDDYFNDEMVSPFAWDLVLDKFKKLKVCLAHFGGADIWYDPWKFKGKNYKSWVDKIIEMMGKYENFYTDISYFTWDIKKVPQHFESISDTLDPKKFEKAHKNMADLLKKNPVMKKKIMSGTDWYMTEMTESSNHTYYAGQFEFLREVTGAMNADWDAYHQFAVINPLRFIGLLDDKDNNAEEYRIDCTKLEGYLGAIRKNIGDKDFKYKKLISDKEADELPKQIEAMIKSYQYDMRIPNSNKMKNKNDKLIITWGNPE